MRTPRVVVLSGNGPPVVDGVAHYAGALVAELKRQRPSWDWIWVHRRPRWFHRPVLREAGSLLLRPSHGWGPIGARVTAAGVRALRPDLLHVQEQIHSFHESGAAAGAAASVRAPVVTTLHELHVERPSVEHTLELIARSTAIVTNDRRGFDRCVIHAGRTPDRSWWSPSNVPPFPPGEEPPRDPDGRDLVTFGHISPLKRLDLVYRALEPLHLAGEVASWRIVGPFHPERDRHHADLARRLDAPWVHFTGDLPDPSDPRLRRMLAQARAMLLPFSDGASLRRGSLHAAWAFGLPVLTTPPDAFEPDIQDGKNCVLVHDDSPEAWRAAVRVVLDDSALEAALRRGARRTAEGFGWPRLARLHLDLYEELLGTEPTGPRVDVPRTTGASAEVTP